MFAACHLLEHLKVVEGIQRALIESHEAFLAKHRTLPLLIERGKLQERDGPFFHMNCWFQRHLVPSFSLHLLHQQPRSTRLLHKFLDRIFSLPTVVARLSGSFLVVLPPPLASLVPTSFGVSSSLVRVDLVVVVASLEVASSLVRVALVAFVAPLGAVSSLFRAALVVEQRVVGTVLAVEPARDRVVPRVVDSARPESPLESARPSLLGFQTHPCRPHVRLCP